MGGKLNNVRLVGIVFLDFKLSVISATLLGGDLCLKASRPFAVTPNYDSRDNSTSARST